MYCSVPSSVTRQLITAIAIIAENLTPLANAVIRSTPEIHPAPAILWTVRPAIVASPPCVITAPSEFWEEYVAA